MSTLPVNLAADDVRMMASAWPHMRRLQLGNDCAFEGVRQMNVEDLLPFILVFPKLDILGVLLNGDVSVVSMARRPRVGESKSSVATLYLQRTKIKNPAHLAVFILGVFPKARVYYNRFDETEYNAGAAEVNAMLSCANGYGIELEVQAARVESSVVKLLKPWNLSLFNKRVMEDETRATKTLQLSCEGKARRVAENTLARLKANAHDKDSRASRASCTSCLLSSLEVAEELKRLVRETWES